MKRAAQAMFEAAVADPAVVTGLALCQSDLQRSFWLYTRHRALFERACDFDFWAHHSAQAQQYGLGVKRAPMETDAALAGLRQAISAFYQRERQCGDGCVAYLVPRSPGVYLLTVHVKDLAMLRLEFEGVVLKHRVGNPNIHMVLEYSQASGVVRTLVRGGQRVQQMLVEAFAEHLLGVKANAQKIKAPCLDCPHPAHRLRRAGGVRGWLLAGATEVTHLAQSRRRPEDRMHRDAGQPAPVGA